MGEKENRIIENLSCENEILKSELLEIRTSLLRLDKSYAEFIYYTGFTFNEFRELILSGVIKIVPGKISIENIEEIRYRLKQFGLEHVIEILKPEPEKFSDLKNLGKE